MGFFKGENGEFYYSITGNGEPLVILRGLGRSVRHWMKYDEYLARDFRVICMDHRGIGRTKARMKLTDTVYDLAHDVHELLGHLKIDKAHILGVSLGGMVALAMGLKFPERVKSLMILNASVGGQGHLRISLAALGVLATRFASKKFFNRMLANILTGPLSTAEQHREYAQAWTDIENQEKLPFKTAAAQITAALRFRATENFAHLKVPTLVLVGTGDQFVPPDNSETLASLIPGAKFVKIEDAGHEITLDAPQRVLDEIKSFVKGLGSS